MTTTYSRGRTPTVTRTGTTRPGLERVGRVLRRVWPRIRERYVQHGAGRLPTEGHIRNVFTMTDVTQKVDELEGRDWPCPVCGEGRDIRLSKKGRPYYVCDDCGVQVFVRRSEGIDRMRELLGNGSAEKEEPWTIFELLTGRR